MWRLRQAHPTTPTMSRFTPGTCRRNHSRNYATPDGVNWRFRVPDGEEITFRDERMALQRYVAAKDSGDFVVWRRDNVPAYQLAVVIDAPGQAPRCARHPALAREWMAR